MKKLLKLIAQTNVIIGLVLMILPLGYLVSINIPEIWYRVNPGALATEIEALTRDPFAETFGSIDLAPKVFAEVSSDNSLPGGHFLEIPKIGVNTRVLEGRDAQKVLSQGVWRIPQYGSPDDNDQPIILAAHRWGPTSITADYRQRNMFINLPQLRKGDRIEITWDRQLYVYEVYARRENTYVEELADLILVTCQYLDSQERVLIYAKRVI